MATKIIIFDDNRNIRESIKLLVSSYAEFAFMGGFASASECLEIIEFNKPDIVLMDIEMPKVKGYQAVRMIKEIYPHIKIIIITSFDDDDKVFNSICAGANSYILKNNISRELIPALREVLNGAGYMSPTIAKKVLMKFQRQKNYDAPDYNLTSREKDILHCIINGKNHQSIASDLKISYDTVRTHIKSIYSKLHISSLTELINKVLNDGILNEQELNH